MTKLRLLAIAVIGLLVLNLSLVFFLIINRPQEILSESEIHRPERPRDIIINRLKLDSEQVHQYDRLIASHQSTIIILDDSIRLLKNNLYNTLVTGEDHKKDSLINVLGKMQRKIEEAHYAHFVAIKKLCRPEQLARFDELASRLAGIFGQNRKGHPRGIGPKESYK